MDARQEKGLQIAAMMRIEPTLRGWTVPSQSREGKYRVTREQDGLHCSCPDFELRRQTCKHGFAVEFFLKRETVTTPDGETTVTETAAVARHVLAGLAPLQRGAVCREGVVSSSAQRSLLRCT